MNPLLADRTPIDLDRLIDTRLLIQANSGGGKSWCIRRILEQTHGKVQHLVIDPEGEFASLRQKFDYVLAARHGGDTAADPRTARLLAEKLLELNVSAILDIYELKAHERIRFVQEFLGALVDAPKKLWHRAIVVVDEAHVYCPQVGSAESSGALIDLATRGRKRGFCAVLATQRLSKLHKDAAAECNNKLIGRTGLDVDVQRAADELGLGKADWPTLRRLEAGDFFAYGPALSQEVRQIHVGPVVTSHPKAGARIAAAAPPPTAKVRALLPQLADLPAEVEERQKTVDDLKRELADARRKLAAGPAPMRVEVPVLDQKLIVRMEASAAIIKKYGAEIQTESEAFRITAGEITGALSKHNNPRDAATLRNGPQAPHKTHFNPERGSPTITAAASKRDLRSGSLPQGERKILIAAAMYEDGVTREQATLMSGYKKSTRDAYIMRLRERGMVDVGERVKATPYGIAALGDDYEPLPVGVELRDYWLARLPEGEKAVLLSVAKHGTSIVSRDSVSTITGYKKSTRDAYLQRLSTRRLIHVERDGVRASQELF